jgi:hypothetical protein
MMMPAVSAAFGLEGGLNPYKIRSEATEHVLNHMVGPNTKNLTSNFRRQMPIAEMPGKTHQLIGIFMPDFNNEFRSRLNLQPGPVFKLQAIAIGHRNRFRKIEKNIFAVIRGQANAPAMTRVKIESYRVCG